MQYSLFNCLLFKKRLKEKSCNLFWGGWKIMKFDFSIVRESLFTIHHIQLLLNKFGKNFVILNQWRQKFIPLQIFEPLTEKTWGRSCVILVSRKTKSDMAASRFTSLCEKNITQLFNNKDSENTKKSTKQHRLIFESYLKEKTSEILHWTALELAAVLRKFYAEARKQNGQYTQNTPFVPSDFAWCRHFKQELNVDFIKDVDFNEGNRVCEAQCLELKKQATCENWTQTSHCWRRHREIVSMWYLQYWKPIHSTKQGFL